MSLKIPKVGLSQMLKEGHTSEQGLEAAVYRNIAANKKLASITRTSFGPHGMNKMVINHLEKLFVTSDAATIVRELDVVHPAAKLLVMAAQQQEAEMGDATNFVLVLAGQLLEKGQELLKMGLHPSEVIVGYVQAAKYAKEILETLALPTASDDSQLKAAVKTSIAAKQWGYEDMLADIVVEASMLIMPKSNRAAFNVDSIRVVKILGGSLSETRVITGMVFPREPVGSLVSATKAKVAVFAGGIDLATTETKGTVLIKNAKEMLDFTTGEEKQLEGLIQSIADTGVKVVVSGSSIGEMALHYLNRAGIVVVKVLSKFDLRRLCRVTGSTPLTRVGPPMPEEIGFVESCKTIEIGSDWCTVFSQGESADASTRTCTIVIRGATMNLLDDMERAIDDSVNVVKALVAKDARVVPGAGASELELARSLATRSDETVGLGQYAIKAFSQACEIVPRTLAENAGLDATEVLSKLYAAHANGGVAIGVDVEASDDGSGVKDAQEAGILDSLIIKQHAIKLAVHAATTVLSVDQIIMAKQAGGPKPKKNQNWDDD
ncbi:MAG: hypothetical protein SGCHY_003843 [Lobulomycetales sp.]